VGGVSTGLKTRLETAREAVDEKGMESPEPDEISFGDAAAERMKLRRRSDELYMTLIDTRDAERDNSGGHEDGRMAQTIEGRVDVVVSNDDIARLTTRFAQIHVI
jgi:hypothetical protein